MSARTKKSPAPGRPKGSRSFDKVSAVAFGTKVRAMRLAAGIAQEQLAYAADIERSHIGRIERGQSQPTLYAMLKIAMALECEAADLIGPVESQWRRLTFSDQ